jgi:hypothetical protein
MGTFYSDSRYGVELILTFPGHNDQSVAAGNVSQMPFSQDIVLTEFGVVVTQAYTNFGTITTVQLRESSTVLATVSIPTGSAIGAVITASALTASNISEGDTLIFYRDVTNPGVGESDGYIKYRARV